jgi:hypothetical protein
VRVCVSYPAAGRAVRGPVVCFAVLEVCGPGGGDDAAVLALAQVARCHFLVCARAAVVPREICGALEGHGDVRRSHLSVVRILVRVGLRNAKLLGKIGPSDRQSAGICVDLPLIVHHIDRVLPLDVRAELVLVHKGRLARRVHAPVRHGENVVDKVRTSPPASQSATRKAPTHRKNIKPECVAAWILSALRFPKRWPQPAKVHCGRDAACEGRGGRQGR